MKAALISLGSISSKRTADAMNAYFKKVDSLDLREIEVSLGEREGGVFYAGKPIDNYDCIYVKGSFRYASLLRSITTIVGPGCYMPIKAGAFTIGHDKLLTHLKLQAAHIPMPKTYVASTAEAGKKVLKKINYPIVIKIPSGTHGKGVMFADSYESASSMVDALALLKQAFLLQEYIETDGVDTRAFVAGDRVVASMKRIAVKGEKRANIHAGGKGEACVLDDYTKKVAIDTAQAVGCDVCAVDMLEGIKGPMVIEINLSPSVQGISRATKIDVAAKIAQFLAERTAAWKKEKEKKVISELVSEQEIVTKLDFRGERILLPGFVSKITKFNSQEDYLMTAKKGKLGIEMEKKG